MIIVDHLTRYLQWVCFYYNIYIRVPKCCGRGGQRPRKLFDDLRKILSKICKKCKFWFLCSKFWAMSKQYVTIIIKMPFYASLKQWIYSFILFYCKIGLLWFIHFLRNNWAVKSARAQNLTFRNSVSCMKANYSILLQKIACQ